MNVIEKTIEPKNGAIDFHLDVPQEWEGKKIKITLEPAQEGAETTKNDLTQFRGKWAHLPLDERLAMQKELDNMRSEWERPIL